MGTRGAIGFRINGQDKIMYNHFDSYPDGLGEDMVKYAKSIVKSVASVRKKVTNLRGVDEGSKPDAETIAKAQALDVVDLTVSNRSLDDWYCVLRGIQGDLDKTLEVGVYVDSSDFLSDSLFCEYAYIINFDEGKIPVIEFYRGFNKDRSAAGRYARNDQGLKNGRDGNKRNSEYAGVRLVGSCPINDIPDNWIKKFYKDDFEDDDC